jgi:carbon monoxide dehydrogenase subunit G
VQYKKEFTYNAPAADVYAMILDPAFQARRSKVGKPERADVSVVPGPGDGGTVTLVRVIALNLPAFIKKIAGVRFTLTEVQKWPDSAGTAAQGRAGTLDATVKGYSGGAHGTLRLSETAGRTTVAVSVDITVKIRVIGGKIEQVAAGMLDKLLARDQKIGRDWLKGKRD